MQDIKALHGIVLDLTAKDTSHNVKIHNKKSLSRHRDLVVLSPCLLVVSSLSSDFNKIYDCCLDCLGQWVLQYGTTVGWQAPTAAMPNPGQSLLGTCVHHVAFLFRKMKVMLWGGLPVWVEWDESLSSLWHLLVLTWLLKTSDAVVEKVPIEDWTIGQQTLHVSFVNLFSHELLRHHDRILVGIMNDWLIGQWSCGRYNSWFVTTIVLHSVLWVL